MKKLSTLDWIAMILIIVGAINWGLVALADLNVVDAVFGMGTLSKIIYILVGLSGVYALMMVGKLSKK